MSVRYSAAVDLSDSLLADMFVPLVAEEDVLTNHPDVSSNVTDVKSKQSENASLPMLVTEFPIVTEVSPVQPEKTEPPMLVTESGITTEVRAISP